MMERRISGAIITEYVLEVTEKNNSERKKMEPKQNNTPVEDVIGHGSNPML